MLLQTVLFVNIVLFLALAGNLFRNTWGARIALVIWASVFVLFIYDQAHRLGYSEPFLTVFGITIPLYGVILISVVTSLLTAPWPRFAAVRAVLVFIIGVSMTALLYPDVSVVIMNQKGDVLTRIVYTMGAASGFLLCIAGPMLFFSDRNGSALRRLFYVSLSHAKEHRKTLVIALVLPIIAYCLTNLAYQGNIATIRLTNDPANLFRGIAFKTFYWVLLHQFVFIGLAKYVIDQIFKGQETTMWEIVIFGLLFAGLQYYLPSSLVVREFLFGLVFGYTYLKTKSLTYGIAIHSILIILT